MTDHIPTPADVRDNPRYWISGPGLAIASQTACPHDYRLTDSCPGCDLDNEEEEDSVPYAPHPGDLARDVDGEIWFVYADATDPEALYAITTPYKHRADGTPIDTVTGKWGPLHLEHRPEEDPEEVIR